MNVKTMLDSFSKDVPDRRVSRRKALGHTGKVAGAVAIASMPLTLGLTRRAFARSTGRSRDIVDVLNFALTLEYLEDEFYRTALSAGIIPPADLPIFQQISAHETAHVALLQAVLGANAVPKPTFDFTAGSRFDPFGDYEIFKALAQGFED